MDRLRSQLLLYAASRADLPRWVNEAVLRAASAITKRFLLESGEAEIRRLNGTVNQLFSGDERRRMVALLYSTTLIEEISSTSGPLQLCLGSLERIHRLFTDNMMIVLWEKTLGSMHTEILKSMTASTGPDTILNLSVTLAENILTWEFGPYGSSQDPRDPCLDMGDSDRSPLELPMSWTNVVNHGVIALLFRTYNRLVETSAYVTPSARVCLLRLVHLRGEIVLNPESQTHYIQAFIPHLGQLLINLVSSISTPKEVGSHTSFLAELTRALFLGLPAECHPILTTDMFSFLGYVCRAFTWTIREACSECEECEEEHFWLAFVQFGKMWLQISESLVYANIDTRTYFKDLTKDIVSFYLVCRLDKALRLATEGGELDQYLETKDWESNEEEFTILATLARESPSDLLLSLAQTMTMLVIEYRQLIQINRDGTSSFLDEYDRFAKVHEQAHWAVMISGYILADDSFEGEFLTPPRQLLDYQSTAMELAKTILLLLEFLLGDSLPDACQSPKLIETLCDFIVEQRSSLVAFILIQVERVILLWPEADKCLIAKTLRSIASQPALCDIFLSHERFEHLLGLVLSKLSTLPDLTHAEFIEALTLFSSGNAYTIVGYRYLEAIINNIKRYYDQIQKKEMDITSINQAINAIEMLEGLSRGCQPRTFQQIFEFLWIRLSSIIEVFQCFSSAPEVIMSILTLFYTVLRSYESMQFEIKARSALYRVIIKLLVAFYQFRSEQGSDFYDSGDLDAYEDVEYITKIISTVILSDNENPEKPSEVSPTAVDVSVQGLAVLFPLVTNKIHQVIPR
ncbi:Exportin-4 [Neolecta irregularis DAH-3]|uniref:Exportin-4 n=1 Tax=Neolecta irregularis (strain DAH-3) TaxID=1198029 RepID=A0A1U7LMK4_NEOID|nr:Exportin-4 [Neolecta irregularis DAH-3]|eukprot:OLL23813.1 Exportin-4 [Neolecta irregularis DAH-3]